MLQYIMTQRNFGCGFWRLGLPVTMTSVAQRRLCNGENVKTQGGGVCIYLIAWTEETEKKHHYNETKIGNEIHVRKVMHRS